MRKKATDREKVMLGCLAGVIAITGTLLGYKTWEVGEIEEDRARVKRMVVELATPKGWYGLSSPCRGSRCMETSVPAHLAIDQLQETLAGEGFRIVPRDCDLPISEPAARPPQGCAIGAYRGRTGVSVSATSALARSPGGSLSRDTEVTISSPFVRP
ncbi:MAG TPA: hypothetical protein VE889_01735 [Actinomycetota bacterium]|nr:hypothetical protein [Actinomycetota bacterium]